ncbi:hypothetical protein H8K47_12965 [Undibacterium sp. CY7W]|uniref:Uncharacterized protein n=1 Tax=Undibacterium rugosum TaxID=2762291 RepID=A0A923I535_9BURK|nr:hypothetical protein [Undibacterium rugosum]MBC3936279.1 hypothetical protein [Undibacterium rugosum]
MSMQLRRSARQRRADVLILFLLGLAHVGLIALLLRSQLDRSGPGRLLITQTIALHFVPVQRQRTLTARDAGQSAQSAKPTQLQSAGRRPSRAAPALTSTPAQVSDTDNSGKASNSILAGDAHPAEPATLDLQIRRDWLRQDKATPQELARNDPRANAVKPTLSEQFALRLGTLECIFQERLPDGRIYRGPGRWVTVQNLHNAVSGGTGSTKLCARY